MCKNLQSPFSGSFIVTLVYGFIFSSFNMKHQLGYLDLMFEPDYGYYMGAGNFSD